MENGVIHRVILVAIFCLTLGSLSEGKHGKGKQIPSALIIGTVRMSSTSVSGASVVLECGNGISSKHMFSKKFKTDKYGDFQVHLPASASKHVKSIKACSVKLMSSSSEPDCAVSSTIRTTLVPQNSRKDKASMRIFSAGLLTFSALKQSSRCLRAHTDDEVTSMKYTMSPNPLLPSMNPISQNVNDQKLVPNPFFPFPFPPNPLQPPIIPPNPLLPPPSIFPPVPGLIPPPSSILPPVPGLTPPPSGILPPIPGFTPPPPAGIFPPIPGVPTIPGIPALASPPPPPPPLLLPPFPFPPGFPGIPPAASKSSAKP